MIEKYSSFELSIYYYLIYRYEQRLIVLKWVIDLLTKFELFTKLS